VKDVRRYLGRFGITDSMQLMQIGYLSGGQKSRIAFSLIVYQVW
jgi:ATPase subunit of ABC transporter with duplicated ATPase domains